MKDFLVLGPVFPRTEDKVRGHIALWVIAATIEALMTEDLAAARVMDPNVVDQVLTPRRALAQLAEIRRHQLHAERDIDLIDRPTPLQRQILNAFGVDTSTWNRAAIA
jgi:hypothetical protein